MFELFDGYEAGFGLYYVDMEDIELKRYPKLSAHWYSDFLKGTTVGADPEGAIEFNQNPISYS